MNAQPDLVSQAALNAGRNADPDGFWDRDFECTRAILEAAAPIIRAGVVTEIVDVLRRRVIIASGEWDWYTAYAVDKILTELADELEENQ